MFNLLKKTKLAFEAIYYRYKYNKFSNQRASVKIYNWEESINYIWEHRCSVSRYGDGELSMIFNQYDNRERKSHFQKYDSQLGKRLENILTDRNLNQINHKIGLPGCMFNSSYMTGRARRFWERYAVTNFETLEPFIDKNYYFLDACFSRFYMENKDKKQAISTANSIKKLWEGRNIIIIEGDKTRMGVGNDLFSNAASVKRILCPSTDAWFKYDEILNTIKYHVPTGTDYLLLLALGMTATVLAYDLAKLGYQAIDIGHVDIEYEWMIRNAKKKMLIPGKYTNEGTTSKFIETEVGENYLSQIISKI